MITPEGDKGNKARNRVDSGRYLSGLWLKMYNETRGLVNKEVKIHMKYCLTLILFLSFQDVSANKCEEVAGKYIRHEMIEDISYKRKVDRNSEPVKGFLGMVLPSLYCPMTLVEECNDRSSWFNLDEFIKFSANYKEIICSFTTSNLTVVGKKKIRKNSIVYFTKN